MKKHVLTVTLNPAIDKTVAIEDFTTRRTFLEEKVVYSAGGKGINVSRVLNYLGVYNIATGLLGGHSGEFLKRCMNQEKIKNDFIKTREDARTSLTIIRKKGEKPTRLLQKGPIITAGELRQFKSKFKSLLQDCSVVVFSGRNAAGVYPSIYADLIKTARARKVMTVLDTHGLPLKCALKGKPLCIKPNLHEAEAVLGKKLDTMPKIKRALKTFRGMGIEVVIISLHAQGAIAACGLGTVLATLPKMKYQNTVGCGDAFIGGFVYGLERNYDLIDTIRMATACGNANAQSVTPGHISSFLAQKIFKKVRIKRI